MKARAPRDKTGTGHTLVGQVLDTGKWNPAGSILCDLVAQYCGFSAFKA